VRQHDAGRRDAGDGAVRVRGRRAAGAAAVGAAAAAAAAIAVAGPSGPTGTANAAGASRPSGSVSTVEEGVLTSQVSASGSVGYAAHSDGSPWVLVNQAAGVYTGLPQAGDVKGCGEVVYRVDNEPVVLVCGRTPLYRALSRGMTGPDVRELNRTLVRLGYADADELDPGSDDFTWHTTEALRDLQEDRGADETGTLAPSAAVVAPGRLRVTKVTGTLGTPARPGAPLAQATSTRRQVEVDLDASDAAGVGEGDRADVTLPDNTTARGRVTEVGTVATADTGQGAGGDATPKLPVHITLDDRGKVAGLDQAPVQVQLTTARIKDALSVPVTALIAQAGGGYAVEVAGASGPPRRVPVQLGLFDHAHGLVQVTGSGLAAGQKVVTPAA